MLIPREPSGIDQRLPAIAKPWRRWLTDHEQHFLTDNQLSLFVDPRNPGCERILFYPLPFPYTFTQGKWDFEELVNHDSLRSHGPALELAAEETQLTFQPHRLEKAMAVPGGRLVEQIAVAGNTLVITWQASAALSAPLSFSLPYYGAQIEALPGGLLATVHPELYVALAVAGAGALAWETQTQPFSCHAQVNLDAGQQVVVALTCGYERDTVVQATLDAAAHPEGIFEAAEHTWDEFFSRDVPAFSCSDERLEQLYYYQAYTTRANLYDVPYEPFTHPYTCPWKTGAIWQWSWNTPMDSICERWLNDKAIGAGGILLEGTNGGGLNIGTYLHPLRRITQLRSHNASMSAMGAALHRLPDDFDLPVFSTIPHTTPNGLLGAWEFYLCSGDRAFLRAALDLMVEAEREFSRHEIACGLYTSYFVDEFDYSLRLKPFIKGFSKGDPAMMHKMDTPMVNVDYNCYLYALRERILAAAAILGVQDIDAERLQSSNERLKAAINCYLWDPDDGFYYDAHPETLARSGIKCIAGFSPLYAGLASPEQAARLVAHLTNPEEFGTPYPCPSIAIDTPDIDPSLITYGGDCLITSGLWFTVEGLVRYGYTELAGSYVRKAIEMVMLEGPSSSYSYHTLTGKYNQGKHTLAAQCAILTDLIVRYVVGLQPRADGHLEVAPLALEGIEWLSFGPYRYGDRWVTVDWDQVSGYTLHFSPSSGEAPI